MGIFNFTRSRGGGPCGRAHQHYRIVNIFSSVSMLLLSIPQGLHAIALESQMQLNSELDELDELVESAARADAELDEWMDEVLANRTTSTPDAEFQGGGEKPTRGRTKIKSLLQRHMRKQIRRGAARSRKRLARGLKAVERVYELRRRGTQKGSAAGVARASGVVLAGSSAPPPSMVGKRGRPSTSEESSIFSDSSSENGRAFDGRRGGIAGKNPAQKVNSSMIFSRNKRQRKDQHRDRSASSSSSPEERLSEDDEEQQAQKLDYLTVHTRKQLDRRAPPPLEYIGRSISSPPEQDSVSSESEEENSRAARQRRLLQREELEKERGGPTVDDVDPAESSEYSTDDEDDDDGEEDFAPEKMGYELSPTKRGGRRREEEGDERGDKVLLGEQAASSSRDVDFRDPSTRGQQFPSSPENLLASLEDEDAPSNLEWLASKKRTVADLRAATSPGGAAKTKPSSNNIRVLGDSSGSESTVWVPWVDNATRAVQRQPHQVPQYYYDWMQSQESGGPPQ